MIFQLLSIFVLAMMETWVAIPAGLFFKVDETIILLLTITGGITGVSIVVFAGSKIRSYLLKAEDHTKKKKSWSMKVWEKYGVIGLGLLSPILTGPPIGATIAITLGSRPLPVLIWFSIGVIIWSFILLYFTKTSLISLTQ